MAHFEIGRLGVELWHDYEWSGCQWANWTAVALEGEVSFYAGTAEVHLALLGVHARLTWIYDKNASDGLRDRFRDILREAGLDQTMEDDEHNGTDSFRD